MSSEQRAVPSKLKDLQDEGFSRSSQQKISNSKKSLLRENKYAGPRPEAGGTRACANKRQAERGGPFWHAPNIAVPLTDLFLDASKLYLTRSATTPRTKGFRIRLTGFNMQSRSRLEELLVNHARRYNKKTGLREVCKQEEHRVLSGRIHQQLATNPLGTQRKCQ